jgi:hypothetical protein
MRLVTLICILGCVSAVSPFSFVILDRIDCSVVKEQILSGYDNKLIFTGQQARCREG